MHWMGLYGHAGMFVYIVLFFLVRASISTFVCNIVTKSYERAEQVIVLGATSTFDHSRAMQCFP